MTFYYDEVVLVASDRELKAAAQASGLSVLDPAEEEQSNPPSSGIQIE